MPIEQRDRLGSFSHRCSVIAGHDPDSFVRIYVGGGRAELLAATEQSAFNAWALSETLAKEDLLKLAGACLALVHLERTEAVYSAIQRHEQLEREVIAVAARGMVAPARLEVLDVDAFTGPERTLAWVCALGAARRLGRRASFAAARHLLCAVKWPTPWAVGEQHIEREVVLGAQDELDAAEDIERPQASAVAALLQDVRARRAREWLAPVVEALSRGEPLADTATRLRDAASMFEGR